MPQTDVLAEDNNVLVVDASSGVKTIYLPSTNVYTGRIYTIKKIDSSGNSVTIDPYSTQTIDGSSTKSLGSQWKYMTVVSDGSNWLIVASN